MEAECLIWTTVKCNKVVDGGLGRACVKAQHVVGGVNIVGCEPLEHQGAHLQARRQGRDESKVMAFGDKAAAE